MKARNRRKAAGTKAAAVLAAAIAAAASFSAAADVSDGYERATAALGEKAARYVSETQAAGETTKVVTLPKAEEAKLRTDTNVRAEPTADSERVTTLSPAAKVKIWGYASDGWARVYCEDEDGTRWDGYVSGSLLELADGAEPAADEAGTAGAE